jgi:hypothetical protein
VPEILPVARALEAAAVTGDEGGTAWHDRMADLRAAFGQAVGRVERDGRLASGWTVATATDWIWARSHLATWQHLVGERGWTPERYTERSIRSILAEVVTEPPPATGGPRRNPARAAASPGAAGGAAPRGSTGAAASPGAPASALAGDRQAALDWLERGADAAVRIADADDRELVATDLRDVRRLV